MYSLLLGALSYSPPSDGNVILVDFKSADPSVSHKWEANNDPVMGGQSYSTVAVENGRLNFTGACKIVPFLKAPGFITAINSDSSPFADVSGCDGLTITGQADTNYSGFRISFGYTHPKGGKFFARGYKSHFWPSVGTPGSVSVAFKNFTDFWDDGTGLPIHTCAEDPQYCPDAKTLKNMGTMSIWAEGVEGSIHLELDTIAAYGCKPFPDAARVVTAAVPVMDESDCCGGPPGCNGLGQSDCEFHIPQCSWGPAPACSPSA